MGPRHGSSRGGGVYALAGPRQAPVCSAQLEGGTTVRWSGLCSAGLIASLLACAGTEPQIQYVPATERAIDLYADPPAAPSGPITNGEDALAIVLRDEALLRHLRRMDANYSGRRRERLDWNGKADFRTEPETRSGEAGEATPQASALGEVIASEGGYWVVRVASDVRETKIFYICELRVAPSGRPLDGFEPKRSCGWRNP